VGFDGFTWDERFVVASTTYDYAPHGYAMNAYLADPEEWAALFKMPDEGPPGIWRVIFPVPPEEEEALTLSDQVAVMRNGVIEQLGAPRALYETPANEFVAGFLGASNFFDGRVVGRGVVEIAGHRSAVGDDHAIGAGLRLAVRPEKITLSHSLGNGGLRARVSEIVYRGANTHLYLDSAAGPIIAYVQNAAADAMPWQVGDEAACAWSDGSAVVLGAEV